MSGYSVIITWMDGRQETYRADGYPATDKNGTVLHIIERYGVTGGVKEDWHLPVANIRAWKAEPR